MTTHTTADRFNITESSIVRCKDRVFNVFINYLKPKFIIWPEGNTKCDVNNGFQRKANFPGIIGAIEGTHIQIKAPKDEPKAYVNCRGFHSLTLQAVCRGNLSFTHIVPGRPGS